jgi:hypothetical protein
MNRTTQGIDEVIQKPFTEPGLLALIEKLVVRLEPKEPQVISFGEFGDGGTDSRMDEDNRSGMSLYRNLFEESAGELSWEDFLTFD